MEAMVKSILKNTCHRAYVMSSTSINLIGVVPPKDVITGHRSQVTGRSRIPGASELQIKYDKLLIELQDLENRLETQRKLVLVSPLMMHSVDRQGVIRMANRALHNCLGYPYGELLGKTIFNLYPHNQNELVRLRLDIVLETGFHDLVETAMVTRDQHLVKVEVISSSYSDDRGLRVGTITVSRMSDKEKLKEILDSVAGQWRDEAS